MNEQRIDLVQPRHNYAPSPDSGKMGQIYLPTSLLTAGARLIDAGAEVTFHDENFRPAVIRSGVVGVNLLGAPYIPTFVQLKERYDRESGKKEYVVGGKVVDGLTQDQFEKLFGDRVSRGNVDAELVRILRLRRPLQPKEATSLVSAYERITDEDMREYLSRESALYVSQGCGFRCNFCAAEKETPEVYRDVAVMEKDLSYLVNRSRALGLNRLSFYMSNLDVFQTPQKLLEFARMVNEVKSRNPGFEIRLRGLATVTSFLNARKVNKASIEDLVEAGFDTVGFGIDGWGQEIWRQTNKGQNTKDKCMEAIRSTREDFGITPEMLMVFGHEGIDTEESLNAAYNITLEMQRRYRAVARPHVSKSFIPGNAGWMEEKYQGAIAQMIEEPETLQALDFTALPSPTTHSDKALREMATEFFIRMCEIKDSGTLYVKPLVPGMSEDEKRAVTAFNEGRYDH